MLKNALNKMTKEELLIMISCFERYPSVTRKDDKPYIIAYLLDESCVVSQRELKTYIFKKRGKSKAYQYILELMDKDWCYLDAQNEALSKYIGVREEDLKIELDIYT